MKKILQVVAGAIALILSCSAQAGIPSRGEKIPRPEFPQPQFEREAWQNLNGAWTFEFDDSNRGLDENWARSKDFTRKITVPYPFESRMSGIGDTSFHSWAWYRRSFKTPSAWHGRRVLLHFGAVDYRAKVWVNGEYVGEHEGGNTPFSFDVTQQLSQHGDRPNSVTVRAEDPATDTFLPRGKQSWELKSRGIFYTRTSGIWQTVWLEATGSSYLDQVRVVPSQDGRVEFHAKVSRYRPGLKLQAEVRFKGKVVAQGTAPLTVDRNGLELRVASPELWSVETPHLYDVEYLLMDGTQIVDRVRSYFGFRTVGVLGNRVTLNGQPIYLKMVLDQGYWPESILTPPSDEAIQFDIRMTKELGFNGARKHQKIEDPRYLYWADRMGLLVSSEMANAQNFDPEYAKAFTREWMEALERDFNHPSIIFWVPLNESWGVPDLQDPRQRDHLRAMVTLTHSLDPSRLVIDNDGWEHTEATDLFSVHDYSRTGELLYSRYQDFGKSGFSLPENDKPYLAPGIRYNGTPLFLSEFGGIGYIPSGDSVPDDAWGYSNLEKTAEAAVARMQGIYAGLERLQVFSGFCYTQLTDVEQEVNGLLTYDRRLKFEARAIREINGLPK